MTSASYEGRTFGRFHILARVGAGGMGEVYRARDEHLRRDVAIKFLQPGLEQDRRLMRREAHALSRLNHANIATVHDLVHEGDLDFVVMEFIEGEPLDERLDAGLLDSDTAVEFARQIAAGLGEAHEHGIVHRDLKPGNVMITARGQVKLVDFGLATLSGRIEEAATATDAGDLGRRIKGAHTDTGKVTGTLPYMAPEQIAGRALDARTDIWAFGAVLYQMVTGQRPFIGPNSLMLAEGILNREPVQPRDLVPDVPAWLEEIILRALQKAPERRFQSVAEIQQALERRGASGADAALSRARTGESVVLPAVSAPGTIGTGGSRRRVVIGAVVALALAAGLGAWAFLRRGATTPPTRLSVLVGDNVNRTSDPTFDQVVTELLATSLEQSRFLMLYPRPRAAFVLQLMHKPPDTPIDQTAGLEICQREGLSALLTSSVTKLGDAYVLLLSLQDPTGRVLGTAKEQFAEVSDLPARIDEAVHAIRANIGESAASIRTNSAPLAEVTSSSLEAVRFYTMGRQRMLSGDAKGSIVMYEKALELDPKFAMALEGIGVAYTNLQDYVGAERYIGRAAELVDSVPETERHKILGVYNMLRRNYDEACSHLEVLTQLRPLDPAALINLGLCESYRLDNARAIADTQRAIDMQPTFRARLNLARFQFLGGDPARALEGANLLRREVPTALHGHYVAGQAELALGKLVEARKTYETMVGLGGPAEAEGHVGLGDLELATGRIAEARAELERGFAVAERIGNANTASYAAAALAELALGAGSHTEPGPGAGSNTEPGSGAGSNTELDRQLARLDGSRSPVVHYLRVRTLARAGRVEEAERAIAVAPGAPPAEQGLGAMLRAELALARGDAALAVKEAAAAWGFEPSVLARETQARAYAAAGKRAEAAASYAEVLDRAPQRIDTYDAPGFHRVIDVEYRLGVLLDDLGERERARPHLERVATTLAGVGDASETYRDARRRLAGGAAGKPTPTR